MRNYIEEIYQNVQLQEGPTAIEQFLVHCYFQPGMPTKELVRKLMLPVPVATAIKKELIRAGALQATNGLACTEDGRAYTENVLGFGGLDRKLFDRLMQDEAAWKIELPELSQELRQILSRRPQANVQLDQAKCTAETSLRRAILCLRNHALVGKKILCVGDDDLVSVSLALLLKRLFPGKEVASGRIEVVDIDERFLQFITEVAKQHALPIRCHRADLRQPLPKKLHRQYDCFFTDPPYTLQGMSLFLSRGISGLQKRKGLPIFLSFAHKSPDFALRMQQQFVQAGVSVREVISHFNEYEGAQMLDGKGQMIVLATTEQTAPIVEHAFTEPLYTGEEARSQRLYRCQKCAHVSKVGAREQVATIEVLKSKGCPRCRHARFALIARRPSNRD
ncbi:bis-aminopropyl spermidine synthase family protein [Brevibacillus agri]|uniref:bis-aminopropyl spermidine synthase family protein n=1 Tax=Brevibacillus agri TaxID=51101 RepID=UPI002867FD2C|nr:bis-aminopropyl spermidine synthase family protein [Brevibacillus agri]MED1824933.1 bis-aminopropyl spermidine synthase family protein [Brevibacillus agri]